MTKIASFGAKNVTSPSVSERFAHQYSVKSDRELNGELNVTFLLNEFLAD